MILQKYKLLCLLFICYLHSTFADCIVHPFRQRAPLVLGPSANSAQLDFIYPRFQSFGVIYIAPGDFAIFACPNNGDVFYGELRTPSLVRADCNEFNQFVINGRHFHWDDIFCKEDPVATSKFLDSNTRCGNNARLAGIGFDLGYGNFFTTIEVCFNSHEEKTVYSKYKIPYVINGGDDWRERPFFIQDEGFFRTRNVDNLYRRGTQRSTINRLLGLWDGSTQYIQHGDRYFLSRGHLAAKKDFFYRTCQSATFRYLNAAPQWQTLNGENWNQMEIDTRNYAHQHFLNLTIYTGTYGVDTLPNQHNILTPLSLNYAESIPVPAIFWRIIYDEANYKGIVVIGVNNPYKLEREFIICPDISYRIRWLNWNREEMSQGYSYVCSISSFKRVVQNEIYLQSVPNIDESNLLL